MIPDLIAGGAGEFTFCSACESEIGCFEKRSKPKILKVNNMILHYFFKNKMPFKGDLDDQPEWFSHLWTKAENEKSKIMAGRNGN